jgi:hypothetical protein
MDPTFPFAQPLAVDPAQYEPRWCWITFSGITVSFSCGFLYAPPAAMIGPEQPIPFSHRLHSGVKAIQCQYCHPYVEHSNHPGLPPVEKCLHCHNYIIANHWWIQKEHEYYNTGTPTPWVKANFLAEHVLVQPSAAHPLRSGVPSLPWPNGNHGPGQGQAL